jgi:hypothetical protein
MFRMPYGYSSAGLSYTGSIAGVAFKLVYPASVTVLRFLCQLLKYCIGWAKSYLQTSFSE